MRRFAQPGILLFLMTILTLIRFDRPLVRGDGVAYLAWTDSLVIDRDANLENQAEKLAHVNTAGQVVYDYDRGLWVSVFPFGIAFAQAPFYASGHFFAQQHWLMVNTDYFLEMQGVPFPYSFWVMIGANLMALAAVFAAYWLGRRFCDPMTAALTAYVVFIGTPLFYYSTISPMHSHNSGAFGFVLFLWLLGKISFDSKQHTAWYTWVVLGMLAGFTVMIRWQVLLSFIPAWGLLVYERRWQGLMVATTAAAITLLPLPIIFHELYGEWLVIPYNSANNAQFLHNPLNDMVNVARSTVMHSPIILLSVAGSVLMWRKHRSWGLMLAAMIGLQIIINGAALDWWGGESYGIRRMTEIYAVYAVLACGALGQIISWGKRHISGVMPLIVRSLLLLFTVYTFIYIIAFIHFTWTHPSGEFSDTPAAMIRFLHERDRVFRWQIIDTLFEEHVGPPAWQSPNP